MKNEKKLFLFIYGCFKRTKICGGKCLIFKVFIFFKMKNEKKLFNRHIIEFEAVKKKKVFLGKEPFGEGRGQEA